MAEIETAQMNEVPARPCTPSPQPGDKTFIEGGEESQFMSDGFTQLNVDGSLISPGGPIQTPQYFTYYQYPTMPPNSAQSYGQTLVYAMPLQFYQQGMRQQNSAGYSMPQQQEFAHPPPKLPMEAPTIVKTPSKQRVVLWNYCQFCQNNREPEELYRNHVLRDETGRIQCPVLRAYNCPLCNNGGGDRAHTKSYCPSLKSGRMSRRHSMY